MTRKERVLAVIGGGTPDRTPAAFSSHFSKEEIAGEAALRAHLNFFEATGVDICKVMNENLLRGSHKFEQPGDLAKAVLTEESKKSLDDEVELVARLAEALKGEAILQVTIHGPLVSVQHMSQRPGFFVENLDFYHRCVKEDPASMKVALELATETLCDLVERCLDAGADGIYFAALGSQKALMDDDEYASIIRPYDLRVFEAASKASANTLHICGMDLAVHRFTDYPAHIVNWEFDELNPGMAQAFELFDESYTVMGGIDNKAGAVVDGPVDEIEAQVHSVLRAAGDRRFILGAGCTMPGDINTDHLKYAVAACQTYKA